VHVLFVALYSNDGYIPTLERAVHHFDGGSRATNQSVQFHAVVNAVSRRVPPSIMQHVITAMPQDAREQHHNLSRGKPRGAAIFLWKAFLYRLVPVDKVIVLDLDIVLTGGTRMHGLWSHFDTFGPRTVFGVVSEQGPTYANRGRVAGVNGGVQLHHLARMRASVATAKSRGGGGESWGAALRRCAAGGCVGWDRIEPSLGDQTLYTHMCLSEPHLCHRLPCGWNRQLSTRYFTAADFVQSWHACDARCRLIHFNQPLLERMVPVLQQPGRPPSCAECRAALGDLENAARTSKSKNPKFTWGASKQYMARLVDGCCCPAGGDGR
jgi:hypothetical protein